MRGKKAKTLRRAARKIAVAQGFPARELIYADKRQRTAVNNLQSERGIYRRWKRIVRERKIERPFTDQ